MPVFVPHELDELQALPWYGTQDGDNGQDGYGPADPFEQVAGGHPESEGVLAEQAPLQPILPEFVCPQEFAGEVQPLP